MEVAKLHTIRKTVLQMLSDRGYDVSHFDLAEQFKHLTRKDLEINVSKMNDPSDKMYIFFPEEELIRVATWRTCFDILHSAQAFKAILVVRGRLTHQAQTCIDELPPPFRIEIFEEKCLMYNVTHHALVPKHEVLSDEEKKSLLEGMNMNEDQLAQIKITDPVAKYFGLIKITDPVAKYFGVTKGQVMKIHRPIEDKPDKFEPFWRLVVED